MLLNGEGMQDQPTTDMLFDIPAVIAFASSFMTLEPGMLILTGTPGGVGGARTPPRFLRAGDVCRVEIDGVGILQNPVIRED
jgi:acylpyruvate hydrolase